jgi:hypothetical protein
MYEVVEVGRAHVRATKRFRRDLRPKIINTDEQNILHRLYKLLYRDVSKEERVCGVLGAVYLFSVLFSDVIVNLKVYCGDLAETLPL